MSNTVGTTTERYSYARNVHGDISLLIGDAGAAKASYGYTSYGDEDTQLTKGDSVKPGSTNQHDPLNPFRFNDKRYDTGSGSIDMGARRFGPDTGRFLQRDLYHDALDDLDLATDPLTGNRYGYAGGNPIGFVEVDGHHPTEVSERAKRKMAKFWWFRIQKNAKAGVVWGGLFIRSHKKWVPFVGKNLAGDDRGFNARAAPGRYRAYFRLNFKTGWGYIRVNPTCNDGGKCHRPHDIRDAGGVRDKIPNWLPLFKQNRIQVSTKGNTLRIKTSLQVSEKWYTLTGATAPSISNDWKFTIGRGGARTHQRNR